MMKRLFRQVLLAVSMIFILSGCSSRNPSDVPVETGITEDDFLSRPRFEKALGRPLGRVEISWDRVDSADGYEIQMSDTESFNSINKKWTIRGSSLELPIEQGSVIWFRIRAFDSKTTSRWSTSLKVEEQIL